MSNVLERTAGRSVLAAILLLVPPAASAENPPDLVPVSCPAEARVDTIELSSGVKEYTLEDTFIAPGSLRAVLEGELLVEGEDYEVHYTAGRIGLLFEPDTSGTLEVSYRNYPLTLPVAYRASIPLQDREPTGIPADERGGEEDPPARKRDRTAVSPLFTISGAKGISVERGRGGEFSMDQYLDLSVNGSLPGGTDVKLQLSDQSIPVSADGSSAELRELDNVSFHVSNGPASATLGDYHYSIDSFEFARVERKLEGVRGEWTAEEFTLSGAGAVSPGMFATSDFRGVEGKQGPYRLSPGGAAGGVDLIILAGTERVYLDGILMERGEGRDYTIDYNEATITFTSRRLISSDSRFEADFEYSEIGRSGSFYATTFSSRPGEYPFGMKGYFIRETEMADSTAVGSATIGEGKDDRMGIAYDYETGFGLKVEGEGAYQSARMLETGAGPDGLSTGAYWFRTSLDEFSLLDGDGEFDSWRLSWYEKDIQDGFTFPGRRYEPDFQWKWGLSPDEAGQETWRVVDVGLDLARRAGVGLELGRIGRESGESALRKRVTGSLADVSFLPAFEGELFSIESMRRDSRPGGSGQPRSVELTGRSLTLSRELAGWTPSVGYSRRRELAGGNDGWGESYDEISPSIRGIIAGRVRTLVGFQLRDDRVLDPDPGTWRDEARSVQGRAEAEYGEGGDLRVRGSTEFRRKTYSGDFNGTVTTLLGRGEVLAAGWDRLYSTSTIYEMNSTSNVQQRAIFVPETEDEGEYLEDGTYVGPGVGTHVRRVVSDAEAGGQVIGASLTSIQTLDLGSLARGSGLPLASLLHSSTLSLKHERMGGDRWRVYLFLPAGQGGEASDIFRSVQYRGELEGAWGEEAAWTTLVDIEYANQLDRRYSNLTQEFLQRKTGIRAAGSLDGGFDLELDLSVRRRLDETSYAPTTDLRERRVGGELGYTSGHKFRYFLALDGGASRDLVGGTRLRDFTAGPGLDVFFGGGGNLNAQYRLENVWNETPGARIPLVMLLDRDVGTSHHFRVRANCRIRGSLDFTASYTGRKRSGNDYFENTGRTEFSYRF